MKMFRLRPDEIVDLVPGRGGCFATYMITVQGLNVGYMYREEPNFQGDIGWRFFAGEETQEYVDNADNLAIYDVNTIANYDSDIIPFLDEPIGSAFERDKNNRSFVAVPLQSEE